MNTRFFMPIFMPVFTAVLSSVKYLTATIDQFEISSKTDTIRELVDRMLNNKRIIGDRDGSIEIVPIK